jgi:gamma-glutamyltranspeptidase/glutathione hydrolase
MASVTHRSNVYAKNGVAAASQPLAVSAGIEILRKGGSASDAAIAMSAVLCVVEPGASHLGGDAFVITHKASDRSNLAFNGSGEAPHSANASEFPNGIDLHGYRSATVPGLVSTWFAIHDEFGLLPMEELLAPAIEYAENGFPANIGFVRRIAKHLKDFPDTKVFSTMGIPTDLKVGDIVTQRNLARTLSLIADEGRAAFYEGEVARALVDSSNSWFNLDDLASHRTRVIQPLTVQYRDYYVHGQPPPSQGMILLEELRIAEQFNLTEMSEADRIHVMVEAKKIAFADRYRILGDPEHVDVNVAEILSRDHVAKRATEIDLKSANLTPAPENQEGSDTTYFLAADRDGNAVSWIQSVFHGFGASWAIPGTGVLMNNRLTGFSLDENSPNFIVPGKRPAHTLNAWTITRRDGSLAHVGGTPGANIQVQSNFQLVVNAIDLKLSPQENAEAPRWQHLNKSKDSSGDESFDGVLQIENRVPHETLSSLTSLGHTVEELPPYGHGSSVQLLEVLENGTYIAGSDPRCEGHAAGI